MKYNNNNSATTCATMHREDKNGTTTATLNGTVDTATAKDEYITHPRLERTNYNQGGRLKFFKDGKFILELERAREGERVSWVSVPRKTFWPPQSTPTSTPTYRQESSTSLSVSDDNSSIQSSPWQRDHSWKQTTPQRHLSKALCFYYRRRIVNSLNAPVQHSKCHYRRPYYDIAVRADGESVVGVIAAAKGDDNVILPRKCRRVGLLAIVQGLVERIGVGSSAVNGAPSLGAAKTPPRQDVIVSPRKRFLREMDRDNKAAVEDSCQKRSRSKQNPTTTTTLTNHTTCTVTMATAPLTTATQPLTTTTNGTVTHTIPLHAATTSVGVGVGVSAHAQRSGSSYSITSLLAEDRPSGAGSRAARKASPVASVTPAHPVYLGYVPSAEERLYTENVDRLRSIELSHADKRGASSLTYNPLHSAPSLAPPTPILHPSYAAYLPYHHHPAIYHPHNYTPAPSPLYYAALYASQQQQSIASSTRSTPYPHHHPQSPYILPTLHPPLPSRGHSLLTGLHHHHQQQQHHSNSVWTTPVSSIGVRQSVATLVAPSSAQTQPADLSRLPVSVHQQHAATLASASVAVGSAVHSDALPDMPLNLSKNAG